MNMNINAFGLVISLDDCFMFGGGKEHAAYSNNE